MIWRDDTVMAFLSIGARNPGHVLVVPVRHAAGLLDLPAATAHRMFDVAQRMARAIRQTDLAAEGFTLKMNTGAAAGQTVFHAHLHVIPRFAAEPPEPPPGTRVPKEQLDPVADKIRAQLDRAPAP
ncbi:MAG: HIT family protein [Opitutae bacterium]|nr:HIT family protein [Opitutae bacterium]